MRASFGALAVFLSGLCVCASVAFAEIVTEVGRDGTLTLESGKQVVLAGVHMDAEGISVLRVLAQKQDVKLQLLANSPSKEKEFAYVYLQSKYIKFPWRLDANPSEKEILLNEFLVEIGAAKVAEAQDFSRKARFLKVQHEAERKGEGVWSYAVS